MTQDDDLDLMLADSEDTFTIGDVTVPCQLMGYDEVVGQSSQAAGQVSRVSNLLVKASAFPSIATKAACQVNGIAYSVAQHMLIQDGRVLQVFLGNP